jgi:hypothetical protein
MSQTPPPRSCDHWIGIWDNETSVIGRCLEVRASNPWATKSKHRMDFEPFTYCPDCGQKLEHPYA